LRDAERRVLVVVVVVVAVEGDDGVEELKVDEAGASASSEVGAENDEVAMSDSGEGIRAWAAKDFAKLLVSSEMDEG